MTTIPEAEVASGQNPEQKPEETEEIGIGAPSESPEREPEPPLVAPTDGVCAVIFVEGCKQRQIKVPGRSGAKYTFSHCNKFRGLVRRYTNAAEFMREERDMRLCRRSQYVLTTRLGAAHPAVAAEDALEELINDRRRVQLHVLEPALVRIAERARSAMLEIEAGRREMPPVKAEPRAETAAVGEIVELPPNGWKEADTGLPVSDAPLTASEEAAGVPQVDVPAAPKGGLTHADFMTMPWNESKKLAAANGVEVGTVAKDVLAVRFLEAQAKGFPGKGK